MCVCVCTCVCIYIYKVKFATVFEGHLKVPFSIATTPRCRGGYNSIGLINFTLDPYVVILSVKQEGIKYNIYIYIYIYIYTMVWRIYIYIYQWRL